MRKTVSDVLSEVAHRHGLTVNDLKGTSRVRHIAHPRQEAYYEVFVQCPHISYPEMARRIGGRDHTTCMFGVKKHCKRNNISYENAKALREKRGSGSDVWIRSTALPKCAHDYRLASSIYAVEGDFARV